MIASQIKKSGSKIQRLEFRSSDPRFGTDLDDLWVYRFYGSLLVFKLFKLLLFAV